MKINIIKPQNWANKLTSVPKIETIIETSDIIKINFWYRVGWFYVSNYQLIK